MVVIRRKFVAQLWDLTFSRKYNVVFHIPVVLVDITDAKYFCM